MTTIRSAQEPGSGPDAAEVLAEAPTQGLFAQRYEILGLVGEGGMGSVYRARDEKLDEIVALKVVRPELARPEMLEHLRREVKLGRRVTHKNIARVFDLGEHEGVHFFTMELVPGDALAHVIEQHGRLSVPHVLHLARELARGLTAAHEAGVVHRDLKPDNVIVSPEGRVVITDFGIASPPETTKNLGGAHFFGTPAYMAPEQVDRRAPVDGRADLYALGVLLFEAITGTLPWVAATPLATAAARLLAPPPDPRTRAEVPDWLAEIILALLAREPEARPADAAAVLALLDQRTGEEVARPSAAPLPSAPAQRRLRVAVLTLKCRPEDDELSAGLTQDLVDGLAGLPGLSVIARPPSPELEADLARLGRELDVAAAVTGAVTRPAHGRVRMVLRVATPRDGVQIWSRRFEHGDSEVLTMNDEATRAIGEALSVFGRPAPRSLPDPEAIDLYLKARARFRRLSNVSVEEAVRLLALALRRAPESPMLLGAYATALARHFFFNGQGESEARGAALRAIEVDPGAAEGHFALATVELQACEYPACVAALSVALARSPLHAEAHFLRGRLLLELGELSRAQAALDRVVELDPGIWLVFNERARLHALRGAWLEAELDLDASAAVAPSREASATRALHRLRLALWRGTPESMSAALAELDAFLASGPTVNIIALAQAIAGAVRRRAPLDVPAAMRAVSSDRGSLRRVAYFHQLEAEVAGVQGDVAGALAAIGQAVEARLIDRAWLRGCPALELVRGLPRYAELAREVDARAEPVAAALR